MRNVTGGAGTRDRGRRNTGLRSASPGLLHDGNGRWRGAGLTASEVAAKRARADGREKTNEGRERENTAAGLWSLSFRRWSKVLASSYVQVSILQVLRKLLFSPPLCVCVLCLGGQSRIAGTAYKARAMFLPARTGGEYRLCEIPQTRSSETIGSTRREAARRVRACAE